jgi:acetylornithine deacetylase/succinyl-diaminopimelate desuccinylase-like protein
MTAPATASGPGGAAGALGDDGALRLLQELVAIAPTNLEDLAADRFEKPNYRRASEAIVRAARAAGLATRLFDPLLEGPASADLRGIPRPNVIADLDVGAPSTVLILAHYDVVPVPAEQRGRWKSPPHTLTQRPDGRLYGRGANDDLGSGIVGSLLALRRLADRSTRERLPRNVRLLACCDEETGGAGGIEAIREHDDALPASDPERILRAEVALIPDGSPETTAGSSGVAFLEASFAVPPTLRQVVDYGRALVGLNELARGWKSVYASPDWPDRGAPEPVITGRASLTKLDRSADPGGTVGLVAAHAETDAANQVARAVTLVFAGPAAERAALPARLAGFVGAPFRLEAAGATALSVPAGTLALQVIGEATHGGYPHRGHNPVPPTLELLDRAIAAGLIDGDVRGPATMTVDLRLTPEMELEAGVAPAIARVEAWAAAHDRSVRVVAPEARCRPGYALRPDHPAALRLERILRETLGARGIEGEYGGTDASSLRGLTTPAGEPLPALVFGSMDPSAHIHDAEESVDPRLLAGVARTIERFVAEP